MPKLTRAQVKARALEIAFWRLHDATLSWPLDDNLSDEDHNRISKELDALAQRMFERAEAAKERLPKSQRPIDGRNVADGK